MNRNIEEISTILNSLKTNDIVTLLNELLTQTEIITLSKRWQILKLLKQGLTQREISKELNVSLCKVTRGAKIMKNEKSIIANLIKG